MGRKFVYRVTFEVVIKDADTAEEAEEVARHCLWVDKANKLERISRPTVTPIRIYSENTNSASALAEQQ